MRCTFFWKWGTTGAFLPVLAAIVGDQFCSFLHIFGGPGVPNAKQKTLQRSRNCNYKDTASGKLSASDAVMLLKYATSPNSQIFTLTFLHCLTFTHSPGLKGILSTLVLGPIYTYNFVQPCSINSHTGHIELIVPNGLLLCACSVDVSSRILVGRFSSINAKSGGSSSLLCLARHVEKERPRRKHRNTANPTTKKEFAPPPWVDRRWSWRALPPAKDTRHSPCPSYPAPSGILRYLTGIHKRYTFMWQLTAWKNMTQKYTKQGRLGAQCFALVRRQPQN